jgi:small subunit ribosomal protein S19e
LTTVFDVPPNPLIEKLAADLQEVDEVEPPEWVPFAKTGVHKERPPQRDDWWYVRTASVLRKVYTKGPIGVSRLRREYSGNRDRGAAPNHARKGSGSVVRNALQQIEAAGLVEIVEGEGRRITPEGESFADDAAHEVRQDLEEERPELFEY